jgi:hypothetical protein
VVGTLRQLPRFDDSLEASTFAEAPERTGGAAPVPTFSAKVTLIDRLCERRPVSLALTFACADAPLGTSPRSQTTFGAGPATLLQFGEETTERPAGKWSVTRAFSSVTRLALWSVAIARAGSPAETAPGTSWTVRVALGAAPTDIVRTPAAAAASVATQNPRPGRNIQRGA